MPRGGCGTDRPCGTRRGRGGATTSPACAPRCATSAAPSASRPRSACCWRCSCARRACASRRTTLAALDGWPRPGPIAIPFSPARVLLQDYTGIPVLVDLAALRSAAAERGLPPDTFRCAVPADLVIDHSLSVDVSGRPGAAQANAAIEMERNRERFQFLKWAEHAFPGLRLFPPGSGICHQINMERLATVVRRCRPRRPPLRSGPTPCSAPTATPRRSTASACSAGASAASRRCWRCSAIP